MLSSYRDSDQNSSTETPQNRGHTRIPGRFSGALEQFNPPAGGWPWTTLGINISGALGLALLLVVLEELFPLARVARPLVGTGVFGGYTTFSTFAVETFHLLHADREGLAVAYVSASVFGALFAVVVGILLGRMASRLVDRHRWFRRLEHAGVVDNGEKRLS